MGDSGDRRGPGSLFVSCGEASGDQYSKSLIDALRAAGFQGGLWGMLGPMGPPPEEAAWAAAPFPDGRDGGTGAVPRLVRLKGEICAEVLKRSPLGVVVIDSPDFHLPLLKALKKGYRGKSFTSPRRPSGPGAREGIPLGGVVRPVFPPFRFRTPSRGPWRAPPLVRAPSFGHLEGRGSGRRGFPEEKTVALLPGSRRTRSQAASRTAGDRRRACRKGLPPCLPPPPGLE